MAGVPYDTDRVLTLPNVLSLVRLLGVPLFVWLVMRQDYGWAVAVLVIGGATDWFDGHLARRWHQVSRVGQMLDPIADRLYIVAIIVAMALQEIIPWWLVAIIVGRDVLLACLVPVLRTRGFTSLPVHFLGKMATFMLLYAFPLVLLGEESSAIGLACRVLGWAFAIWGTAMYWWAGVLYVRQTIRPVLQTEAAT